MVSYLPFSVFHSNYPVDITKQKQFTFLNFSKPVQVPAFEVKCAFKLKLLKLESTFYFKSRTSMKIFEIIWDVVRQISFNIPGNQ